MIRRGQQIALFKSTVLHSLYFPTKSPPHSHSLKFCSRFGRLINTWSPENLEGLVDPNINLGESLEETSRVTSVSAQDFSFISDSLSECSPSEKKFESCKCSNDVYLILNAIKNSEDVFCDKAQKSLRQFRGKLNESLVIDVLNHIQNTELGVKFFIWSGHQIGYAHTFPVYNALLDLLGCDKNERIPDYFLREIKDDDNEVLGKMLNVLIRKYCKHGSWNVALEELGRLKDFGYTPSRMTYNALVQVFLEADKLDTAYLVHREMLHLGFEMDAHTIGCFVHSLCKIGKGRDALELIEKEDFVPDTIIYTKMISGLCEASLFEEAMDFLNQMRSKSCIPNVITYSVLLCGFLNKRKLGGCKRILSMMMPEGCYPSPRIFNSLVHAYCKSEDYAYAYKLLKKMEDCGIRPGYVVYNILIGGICGNEDLPSTDVLALAERAYSEMLDAGVTLNKVNVSNFAWCLCGAGKFEKAYSVIREMMSKGFIPDNSTYSKVINFLCNASRLDKAFILFQEMKKNGIVPDVYTHTIIIDSFCKAGLIQQAYSLFNEMVRDGCSPNVVTYTALLHAYLKVRKLSDARELFERMVSEGCIPNVVTITALIDGHCKAGEIEKACQIYAGMRKNGDIPNVDMYFQIADSNTIEPNVVTFGALVDGLCKAHKVDEAHKLLEVMSAEGCEPNQIVYDALIDGFCKVGKLEEAQQVFSKMAERGYGPNVYTYSSLIDRLFKDKRLDLVLNMLSKMLENSCPPNVVIYTEMIDGLCKVGKTDEAHKVMVKMQEKGCQPNVVTYTAMIDGFGKAGEVEKSLELLTEMSSKGCAPNYVTYRVLIKHCCAAGLLDEACQLLEDMKQTYWPRHMTSYKKVIEGFSREFIVSLGLLDEISEDDSLPVIPVYMLLIDSFRKAGRLEVALDLYKEVSSTIEVSSSDRNIYAALIQSLSVSYKVDQAFELYAEMIRKGGVPELSAFVNLIKGLIKVDRWEEALELAHSLCDMDIRWFPSKVSAEGK